MQKVNYNQVKNEMILKRKKELKAMRERCDKHLFYFEEYIESDKPQKFFTRDKPHVMLASMVFDLIDRNVIKRTTISLPPRGGKSFQTSKAMQWQLGKHPYLSNMRNSYSSKLAVEVLSHQVRESIKDPLFYQLYEVELHPAMAAKEKWALKNSTRPSYAAAGINGTQSGIGVDNWLVLDDEYSGIEQALSKSIRRQTDNWIESVHLARKEGNAKEIYVCTRWTEYDRIGQIKRYEENYELDFPKYLDLFESEEVTDERFEEIFEMVQKDIEDNLKDMENGFVSITCPALIEVNGIERSYCPAVFSTKHYQKVREEKRRRGQEWIWHSVFQQNPAASGNKVFSELNRYHSNRLWNLYEKPLVIAYIDPAFVDGGDFFAMPIAKVIDGNLYIVDVIYSQKGRDHTMREVIKKIKRWGISIIEGEGNGSGDEYLRRLREKIHLLGLSCSVRIIKNHTDKIARVMMRSGDVVERVMFLDKEEYPNSRDNEYSNFVYELLGANKELDQEYDDAIDSITGLTNMRSGMSNTQGTFSPL